MKKLYGNAVVGQSGGPTAAINATLAGVIRGVKEDVAQGSIKTLYGMRNGVQGLLEERLVDLSAYFDTASRNPSSCSRWSSHFLSMNCTYW